MSSLLIKGGLLIHGPIVILAGQSVGLIEPAAEVDLSAPQTAKRQMTAAGPIKARFANWTN
jgi:hypothetical protein